MITLKTFLIVCPLVFLAGFVDSIGGGGGLISLPAYMLAGLPAHMAIATNKLSSACGTSLSTIRFIREKLVDFRLAVPTVAAALLGSFIGARLSLAADENLIRYIMIPILILAAFIVLNRKLFDMEDHGEQVIDKRTYVIAVLGAFVIGGYDGFYGPGTGTFLIIVLHAFARLHVINANAHSKVINLTTNLTSLTVFLLGGQVIWALGLAGAVFNMAGNYIGSSLSLKAGAKITRPIILFVVGLLCVKILVGF